MRENDNSEIQKDNSSLRVVATEAAAVTASAASKEIEMDNFNLISKLALRIVIFLNFHHHHQRGIMSII